MLLTQHHITLAIPMHFPFLCAPARILNEPPAATADKLRHQLRDSGYWEEHQLLFFISMQADEKAWNSPQTSYRTRRSRDPVSSKLLFSLDSGHPPAADSGMTDLMLTLNTLSFSSAC
jgi:hypothetical protein